MAGGHATTRGIAFQSEAAAWLAVQMLAEVPLDVLGLAASHAIEIQLETDSPVDDIVVQTTKRGYVYVNVKTTVSISSTPQSALASAFDQFTRQFFLSQSSDAVFGNHPLSPKTDRLVLAVDRTKSGALVRAAAGALQRVVNRGAANTLDLFARNAEERRFLNAVEANIQFAWRKQTGRTATVAEVCSLLDLVRVLGLDFGDGDHSYAVTLLRDGVVARDIDAARAWTTLVAKNQSFAQTRSGGGIEVYRAALRDAGIAVRGIPAFAADIAKLQEVTTDTLERLSSFAFLPPTPKSNGLRLSLHRQCSGAIAEAAANCSLVVIGEAGAGKSGALFEAAGQLASEGHPIVALAVDRHPVATVPALASDLGLAHPIVDVLNAWTSEKLGILFIDALDASRGGPSEQMFQELIGSILDKVSGWHIVASIREFDLRFGVRYRALFRGAPLVTAFGSDAFSDVQHIQVPRLTAKEIDEVKAWSPELNIIFNTGPQSLAELLRSPFNLFLLTSIISGGTHPAELTNIATQVELLGRYWSSRMYLGDRRTLERERIVAAITNRAIQDRVLSVWRKDLPDDGAESLGQLLSVGILVSVPSRRVDEVAQVAFAHHRLFDYAVARLTLIGGRDPNLTSRLTDEGRAFVLAPGLMLALQMLWEEDPTRVQFWNVAVAVAEGQFGGFVHTLPARVAAEAIATIADISPLLDRLIPGAVGYELALLVLRHICGIVLADVVPPSRLFGTAAAPWIEIACAAFETAPGDVSYITRALCARWADNSELLTATQTKALNALGCSLLNYASAPERYDEQAVIAAIRAVARTANVAPEQSSQSLSALLAPEHVRDFGYRELFWFAQEFKPLLAHTPRVVADLYRAAYGSDKPSADERTTMGNSRILTLTSTKRQDFEAAQHILGERIVDFVAAEPSLAFSALLDALDYAIPAEHAMAGETSSFPWKDDLAKIRLDSSYVWWRPDENGLHSESVERLLDGLVAGLSALAKLHGAKGMAASLDLIAQRNQWAAVWAAVLRAAANVPDAAGPVAPLLATSVILGALETRKPAGDLIRLLHPRLDESLRIAIEKAILDISNERGRAILIGCLDARHIVTPEAQKALAALTGAGPIPENVPPFELRPAWRGGNDDWYYSADGTDLQSSQNATLLSLLKKVKELKSPQGAVSAQRLVEHWSTAKELQELLTTNENLPERLTRAGWDALADVAADAALASKSTTDLDQFPGVRELILGALQYEAPTRAGESAKSQKERNEDDMMAWSRPSPRIQAAEALIAYLRARGVVRKDEESLVWELVHDSDRVIRHQVLARINLLYAGAPELMWALADYAFASETSRAVLAFFLNALSRVMRHKPAWTADKIARLIERIPAKQQGHDQFTDALVHLLLTLWLWHGEERAGQVLSGWTTDPFAHASFVIAGLGALRGAITLGDSAAASDREDVARSRAVSYFHTVVSITAPVFDQLLDQSNRTDAERARIETALRLLDCAAREIHFGSGAYALSQTLASGGKATIADEFVFSRFLREMTPTLEALADVMYPSVTHSLLETLEPLVDINHKLVFRLISRAVLKGGQKGGYQFESLGAELLVKLVQRYLADYRSWIMANQDESRTSLVRILDVFANAGWPAARKLVYDLPEMLR